MRLLGVITVATAAVKNNKDTAVPFTLPKNVRALALQSDTAAVFVELGLGDTFAATAARGRRLGQFEWAEFRMGGVQWVVSVRNDTGGSANVKVFALP
jgi:hypothetical protein